jgi:hypothetical protein
MQTAYFITPYISIIHFPHRQPYSDYAPQAWKFLISTAIPAADIFLPASRKFRAIHQNLPKLEDE